MDSRGMYDSQVQNETSSGEFVLHPRLPSLQEMACNQIAIAVWYRYSSTASRRKYEQYGYGDHWSTRKLELMDCHKLIKTLAMSRFMKENLKKYLKRIRQETVHCTTFFKCGLFSTALDEYRMRQVDWKYFVWRPDGRISYKSTAIKMLHSGVLTEVQKFAIMCRFCLENNIKSFDLYRRPMKTFIPKVNRDSDPLLFYWICYLKNELHTITPVSFFHSYHDRLQREAFQHFWNHLKAEDQVSFISDKLLTFKPYLLNESMFYKISHDQLTDLLSHLPVAVILFFIKEIGMLEWAILAWKRCKNRISNEQFVKLLEGLLTHFNVKRIHRQEDKASVLLEIWSTAKNHQKIHAARHTELQQAVVCRLLSASFASDDAVRLWKKLAPSCFKFVLKFLSFTSARFRKNLLFHECVPTFVFNFDFHVVHEIFELCSPNSQGKVEFQNEPSTIRLYYCTILYTVEDEDELNRRLLRSFRKLNISSKDTLEKFIESLTTPDRREYQPCYTSELQILSEFFYKVLQENVSTVLSMKQSYISSFSYNSDPFERYGSLNELSKLIEQEFVHEHLQELKRRLAKKLQTTSFEQWVWMVSRYDKLIRVFSWCFDNEEEIFLQVKRCIPINAIISKVFKEIACGYSSFNNLQRFLEWYFSGVEEEVISFKLGLINDPKITEVLEIVQHEYDKQCSGKFLQWMNHPIDSHAKRST